MSLSFLKSIWVIPLSMVLMLTFISSTRAEEVQRTVFVQLFEWKWTDIAKECEEFLGPKGYGAVQISPPNEHRVVINPTWNSRIKYPWFQRYQPVSYKLESRSGTRAELAAMIKRCNDVGVKIYADAVINHMSGSDTGAAKGYAGSSFDTNTKSYPQYSSRDFHSCAEITNYGDAWNVQNCGLSGLQDLSTGSEYVRQTIANYMNDLLSLGVAGFRLDAAKHMNSDDIAAILAKVNDLNTDFHPQGGRPYIFQEVIDMGGEPVTASQYHKNGHVTEFIYGKKLGEQFRYHQLKNLETFGLTEDLWGMKSPSFLAVVFTDNHDNQRGHGAGGFDSLLTFYLDKDLYELGNVFMLAWPYGYPKVMSSYEWPRNIHTDAGKKKDSNDWVGPPSDSNGNTEDANCFNGKWVCEHRWRPIANMVAFRNHTVSDWTVSNWWDNGNNQIAFGRGDKGFVVINKEENNPLDETLQTGMSGGEYCNIIQGDFKNGKCSGPTVTVGADGTAQFQVAARDAAAIHVGAKVSGEITTTPTTPLPHQITSVRIHYKRRDGNYADWGLHLWGEAIVPSEATSWPNTKGFSSSDAYGGYADVRIKDPYKDVNLLVHKNGNQDIKNVVFTPIKTGVEVWLVEGISAAFASEPEALAASRKVYKASARWATRDTIAWILDKAQAYQYTLYHSPDGSISISGNQVQGGMPNAEPEAIELHYGGDFSNMDPDSDFYKKWAYLKHHKMSKIKVPFMEDDKIRQLIKGHLVIVAREGDQIVAATALQKAGVIDEVAIDNEADDLGVTFNNGVPSLKLWAPTAKSVKLHIYDNSTSAASEVLDMINDAVHGTWAVKGNPSWKNKFYLYEVEVFTRTSGKVENNMVTDPYSVSLATNGARSQIIDIENDESLKPQGWDREEVTPLIQEIAGINVTVNDVSAPEDIAIYELHVRDFSIFDETVPEAYRGKFKAFTLSNSRGMKHLQKLAQSGLTHIHLLPVNDIATVNEDPSTLIQLTDPIERLYPGHADSGKTILEVLKSLPPGSEEQQKIVAKMRNKDGFNWGYDPLHFMVPDGSYSTDADGAKRVLEFRELVKSLHEKGLRVIPDVVFNHTSSSDVFDKIVPDYYYRLNHNGDIESSSCCPDTASENTMYEKLIADAVFKWAKYYHIDAVRFDLMGHLTKDTMNRIRAQLEAGLGAKGKEIYLYGEGWDFGSLRWLLPGSSAYQRGIWGMGIGSFNDQFRDPIKGKGQKPDELFPDDAFITDKTGKRDDVIRAMRGSLSDFNGYTSDPQESINYLTAHDKATLWDHLIAKVGLFANLDQMTRKQNLGVGLIALSQGVPFYHAGIEILRSKSGDENSYDSGDWFNRFVIPAENIAVNPNQPFAGHNWNNGVPPGWQPENRHAWERWRKRLGKVPVPNNKHVYSSLENFQDMLKVRKSSLLFRLRTQQQIKERVTFPANIWNAETNAFDPRLLVVKIVDKPGQDNLDWQRSAVWVLINVSWDKWLHFYDEDVKRRGFKLHPVLLNTKNPLLREYLDKIPAGDPRNTAFSDHLEGGGKISVPPQTMLVYSIPD